MKILLLAGLAVLVSSRAQAQDDLILATPTGHAVNVSIGGYIVTQVGERRQPG